MAEDISEMGRDLVMLELRGITQRLETIEAINEARHGELLAKIELLTAIQRACLDAIRQVAIERRLERIEAAVTVETESNA
jgi:hypothetical protein